MSRKLEDEDWAVEVRRLAAERDAVILAHNYQPAQIQDVADHVGDSLVLARLAAASSARTIVLAGVYFMAEQQNSQRRTDCADTRQERWMFARGLDYRGSASCLEGRASGRCRGCLCQHQRRGEGRIRHVLHFGERGRHRGPDPGGEGSAVPAGPVPRRARPPGDRADQHARVDGRMPRSRRISPDELRRKAEAQPDAPLFIHPECGCATPALWLAGTGDLPRARMLSTSGMLAQARSVSGGTVLVATEVGMLHQLRQANPSVRWEPVDDRAVCQYMKMTTPRSCCAACGTEWTRLWWNLPWRREPGGRWRR